ncbi:RagB/SusD family nutrient uptake outer membrane protein [Costertonia aggregata]|uniref:RagB/SusD family nutrient uptake outer membrane protein n=1 Tax=Costertonia aggregata TaxID=343403 RepID=A0A7H9AR82_9FLAO|nr:RagB/SusD family nutrient uptake outer membrane protein [Costertonia aggregata]QLG45944.1 RagB/SusD family nutrient uptake outer membrane protein [Costertonia aggregata]
MKNNLKKILSVLCTVLFFIGCSEDFLVEEPQGAIVNADQLSEAIDLNPDLGEATVTGIYATMFTTETGGTTSQQDFGQKGYDIYLDMLSGDMALTLSSFGWYRARITELQGPVDFTQQENYQPWRYYYRIVNLANLVIESVGGNDANPEDPSIRGILGQALAMRAHSYFYLTLFFINDVEASWTSPTLPIYDVPGLVGKPKSTTEEVYQLMESDLNKAINLLEDFNRTAKTQVDQSVAQTMLAYVLASRRDRWSDVVTLTAAALANTSATPMVADFAIPGQTPVTNTDDIRGGFNDVGASGWMWGVDINADIGLGLVSWWGQIDAFSFSYAGFGDNKAMDIGLYESMAADDIRREQYLIDPDATNHLQPYFKFYDSDRVFRGSSQIVKADYIYMRVEELILLNAEALAKSGQEPEARTALEGFVETRLTSGDASYIAGLSGQALIDEIYKQTRLELWGEGKSYLALKRNRASVTRGANHLSFVGVTMPHDDERLTFEIPQQAIQDNNFINDQN